METIQMTPQTKLVFDHKLTNSELVALLEPMLSIHLRYQLELVNSFMNLYKYHDHSVVVAVIDGVDYHGLIYHDDMLVGFALIKVDNDRLHLSELYVDEEHRCKGIGSAVVANLDDMARYFNVRYVTLGVNARNPAMSLYNKNGFVPRYIEMVKAVE